jgi:hypothetical protein
VDSAVILGAAVRAALIGLVVVSLERPTTDELFVSLLFSDELRPLSLLSSDKPHPLSSGGPWPFSPLSSSALIGSDWTGFDSRIQSNKEI